MIHMGSSAFSGANLKYRDPLYIEVVAVDFPELEQQGDTMGLWLRLARTAQDWIEHWGNQVADSRPGLQCLDSGRKRRAIAGSLRGPRNGLTSSE
jgi:hypothetical protein